MYEKPPKRVFSAEQRKTLAEKITDTLFYIDPYNGLTREEMTEYNLRDLRSADGVAQTISGLCDLLRQLNDDLSA